MSLRLPRKGLVFVFVGLFIAVSIVPVSSFNIKKTVSELVESKVESFIEQRNNDTALHSSPFSCEDVLNPDLRYYDIEDYDDFDRDLYGKHSYYYRHHLGNHSGYLDEPFSRYPDYEEFRDAYRHRYENEYARNHTLKDRKPTPKPNFANGTTWYVDDDGGPGIDFTKIQDAIDAAEDGDTVFVYSGTYHENVVVDKSIKLEGEDRNTTVIIGSGIATVDVIRISADWVNISKFNIKNGGSDGIDVRSQYNVICGNIISDNDYQGIDLRPSSNHNLILENIIKNNNGDGILLENSFENNITGNTILNNYDVNNYVDGIRFKNSFNNCIYKNNIINNNRYGVMIWKSYNNTISINAIHNNDIDGIYLGWSSNIMIINNTFFSNGISISSDNLNDWNTHTIEDNFANERPIYYIKNKNGGTVPKDAIQAILSNCSHFTIENLRINNIGVGILLGFSSYNTISTNSVENNSLFGILLFKSPSNKIINNSFISNGISIIGDNLSDWNAHIIENNYLKGKQIYYYKNNHTGGVVPFDAAQVILANCSNFKLENLEISDVDSGIQLAFSSFNQITNSTIVENNFEGIMVFFSDYNTIKNNTINGNIEDGIYICFSSNNAILMNIFENNTYGGYSYGSSNNKMKLNFFINDNIVGIFLGFKSSNNVISNNIIMNNSVIGLSLFDSLNNKIMENNIANNNIYGIALDSSDNNFIFINNISNNHGYGTFLLDSYGNTLHKNNVSSNFIGGILLENTIGNIISNCTIQNHALRGVNLKNSINLVIQNCNISNNWRGIEISLGSMSNKITSCSISNNYWGVKLANSRLNCVEQCTFADNTVGIMRGNLNFISKNNFIDQRGLHTLGNFRHKNFFSKNYWSGHESTSPYHVYGLNVDWFPKATPYDYEYPESWNASDDYTYNTMWDWDDNTLLERHEELEEHYDFRDWDEYESSPHLDAREYLMDLREESH